MKGIMRTIKLCLYKYHWRRISRKRAAAARLIERGTSCNDPRLVQLSNSIEQHGLRVSLIWQQYREACGELRHICADDLTPV